MPFQISLEEEMGIFEPYRAVGYITSGVPFSVQRLGTETFVTVSVGKAFQIYNVFQLFPPSNFLVLLVFIHLLKFKVSDFKVSFDVFVCFCSAQSSIWCLLVSPLTTTLQIVQKVGAF